MRSRERSSFFLGLLIFAVSFLLLLPGPVRSDNPYSPQAMGAVKSDTSPPLLLMEPMVSLSSGDPSELPRKRLPGRIPAPAPLNPFSDPVLQDWQEGALMPSPIRSFEGINNRNGVLPPDTQGDVGPNHYVQWVNLSFAIWDKQGNLLYGPVDGNTLWQGFGGPCETTNDGDPITLYDHLADRWLMSQFALPSFPDGPYYQCIAVSTTGDPTGAWYRYAFIASDTKMNDYPKFGLWPDGYYMSANQFTGGQSWGGTGAFVFERQKMLDGLPARMIYFDLPDDAGGMLPADLDGPAPPEGSPAYFVQLGHTSWGFAFNQLAIREFLVDWTVPANSRFGVGPSHDPNLRLPVSDFDPDLCNYQRNCIPQPGGYALDAISDQLMYRLQYRNLGDHQGMVTNHTVDVDGTNHAGIRWYELRRTAGDWFLYQEGTYAPDANHRWMGSIAMDGIGNIALGYSVSSTTLYPSIRYAGRLVSDAPGILPQAEQTLMAGSGYQIHSSGRWGDYSMMAVDPVDDCTFWYTQEYYATIGTAPWQTRIGAFAYSICGFQGITVTKAGSGSGTVKSTPPGINCGTRCAFQFDIGTRVRLSAMPSLKSVFSGWSGACSGKARACTFIANGSPQEVTATFKSDPKISVPTSPLRFGTVKTGRTSYRTFSVSNKGKNDLLLGTLSLSGSPEFSIVPGKDNCSMATLPPWRRCSVKIAFTPTVKGEQSAAVNVPSNDPATPLAGVGLRGNGF
jgi:hypothetical protein